MGEQRSYGARLAELAAACPDAPAIHELGADGTARTVTFAELDRDAHRVARVLHNRGVGPGTLVAIALPDGALHAGASFGAWRIGACVLPLSPRLPASERTRLLGVAAEFPKVVTVGRFHDQGPVDVPLDLASLQDVVADPLPDQVPEPALAIGSGGTSGTPKITVDGSAGRVQLEAGELALPPLLRAMGGRIGQTRLVCTPLYHVNGFSMLLTSLLAGDPVVVLERFDAGRVLDAIAAYGVGQLIVVPTVLQRLAQAPEFDAADLSSLEAVGYGGSHCPEWLTRRWIAKLGPERVYAGYGATEAIGKTVLRGDEWLARPGSAGRPVGAELRILGESGEELPPGELGELHMRPEGATAPAFRYLGSDYRHVTPDGFVSLGDVGWVDDDGYLFVADRRTDLIISGGANVFPAEVESVLTEHPAVADAAVVGLPDDAWGKRVHAIVQPRRTVAAEELEAWCAERLLPYKRPKSIELVGVLPRTEVGKLARGRLVEERRRAGLLVTEDEGVLTVRLHRPERLNAMDDGMAMSLVDVFDGLDPDAVRAVVLTGDERAFCTGMDLQATDLGALHEQLATGDLAVNPMAAVERSPVPVVAAVEGHCVGAGLVLALACDIRVASSSATFAFPEVHHGFPPAGGVRRLVTAVGKGPASLLMLSGETVDAEAMARWRGVELVVAPGRAVDEATRLARSIARASRPAVGAVRRLITETMGLDQAAASALEYRTAAQVLSGLDRVDPPEQA